MTTEAPVPLAAQIEKVQREIRYAREDHAERGERLWSAVLATLQQHERAMAALRQIANINNGPDRPSAEWRCLEASAIAGYALITAPPEGKGEAG